MKIRYLESVLALQNRIIVDFIPESSGSQLRAREDGERRYIQPIDDSTNNIGRK